MTDLKDRKLILAVDFDGVVHDYKKGWQDGELYGHATPGFFEWYLDTSRKFEIVIHSSRFAEPHMQDLVLTWLAEEYAAWRDLQPIVTRESHEGRTVAVFYDQREQLPPSIAWSLSATKPPAWLTIDDRCIRFDGDWSDGRLAIDGLYRFRPYHDPRP